MKIVLQTEETVHSETSDVRIISIDLLTVSIEGVLDKPMNGERLFALLREDYKYGFLGTESAIFTAEHISWTEQNDLEAALLEYAATLNEESSELGA